MTFILLLTALSLSLSAVARPASDAWPDLVKPKGDIPDVRDDVAVVVGVESHEGMPEVMGASGIAASWAAFFKEAGIPEGRIVTLLDAEATQEAIGRAVVRMGVELEKTGTFWFVYVGHGVPPDERRDGLLVPVDADPNAAELYRRGKPISSLLQDLDVSTHERAVILLDLGYFGQDGSPVVRYDDIPLRAPGSPFLLDARSVFLVGTNKTLPAGLLPGHDQPAFAYLMLGALRGWADLDDDGRIGAAEAIGWTEDTLRTLGSAQVPAMLGETARPVLSKSREKAPDLDGILWNLAEPRYKARMRRLQEREGEVLAEARQAWLSFGVWSGDPERRSGMASFLEKYRDVTLSEDAITRFVVVSEIDQARLLVASPDEEEGGLNPTLESRHLQISEEIKTLARRNAYKGVEAQFRELLTLVDKGVRPRFEDCLHGAEAARALGDAQATRERLLMALSLSPSTDVKEWLNEVERSYARVRIVNDTRRSLELKPSKAPFAPDQRAALDFARAALDQDGRFDGLLPMGVYHFGKRVFVVVPGDPPVEVRLRR